MSPASEILPGSREGIDQLIETGKPEMAARCLRKLWNREAGSATAAFVISRFEKLRDNLPLLPCRLAILRSFTVEPAVPLLRATAFCYGIDTTVHTGDFNAYSQEILDSNSALYNFAPDVVILAVRTADCAPELWNSYTELTPENIQEICHRVSTSFEQWIQTFRVHSQASLIVHNLEQPIYPNFGVLDSQSANSQTAAIQQINAGIRQAASAHRGVYVLDYDALVARHGRLRWHDERKWLIARMPISANQLVHLSNEWLRFLSPLTGRIAKALVVDLDNTLWGGIVGEDGLAGIQISSEYPGAAYQALQRAMLDLTHRGILLAICSKNNPEDALEALREHPGMVLRPEHFAAMRIGWNDKAQGLKEIAAELNIGIDALVFLDDNPFEREQVSAALPEVTVLDFSDDPLQCSATLQNCPLFERLNVSAEDQQRSSMYVDQKQRTQAEQNFQSKEDFYHFLQQEAEITPVTSATLNRVAQLTQKTNQFNLTTLRFSEQQISEMANRPGGHVMSVRVRDRFGDQGLVGVAITQDNGEICEITNFLLSCRVIGRTVETAFLSHLAEAAFERGRRRLIGRFLPTKKNAPASEFYPRHGFQLEEQNGNGTVWALDLREKQIHCPDWIKLIAQNGGLN
jgi:FkbH-like protein